MSTIPGLPMQKILDLEERMAAIEAKVMPKKEEPEHKEQQPHEGHGGPSVGGKDRK